MADDLKTFYTPQWKDAEGNLFITLGDKDMFEDEQTARDTPGEYPGALEILKQIGVEQAGVFSFQTVDLANGAAFSNVQATHPLLGPIAIVAGPLYESIAASGGTPEPTHDAPERLQ